MPKEFHVQLAIVILTAGAVFVLILSVWCIWLLLLYLRRAARQERMEVRLGVSGDREIRHPRVLRLWKDGQPFTTIVPRMPLHHRIALKMQQAREAMGWDVSASSVFLGIVGLACFVLAFTWLLFESGVIAVFGAAAAVGIPLYTVQRRMNKQAHLFERQLADALALATRSLRAGHPLIGAFHLIVKEMPPPVSTVFGEIVQQQQLGVGLGEAVRNVAARSPSPDMKLFAASMVIQLQSGGNLAETMDRLSEVIRDRTRLRQRAHVLTAQTQLSKRVLIAVPFFLFLALYVLNRDYVALLYTTFAGKVMFTAAAIGIVLGSWVMNRIATLRY